MFFVLPLRAAYLVPTTVSCTQSGTWNLVNVSGTISLPTGAATSSLQSTGNSTLTTINSTLGSPFQAGGSIGNSSFGISGSLPSGSNTIGKVDQGTGGASAWKVDGSAVTQPVSGTFWQATQPISAASLPLPTGAATSALQTTGNTALTTINTTLGTPMQSSGGTVTVTQATGSNLHVAVDSAPTTAVTQSGTWTVQPGNTANTTAWKVDGSAVTQPISAASLPLPTGAATSALQTTGNTSLTTINTTLGTPMQNSGGSVTANIGTSGSLALNTSVTGLQVTQGSTTSGQSGSMIQAVTPTVEPSYSTGTTNPVTMTTRGGLRTKVIGLDAGQLFRNDYSSVNVTTAAYVQLVSSTSSNIHRLLIFDSSGQDFVLATGAAASEVDQIQIPPGGWDAPVELYIPSGSRLSIKSKSATASSGILLITGLK